MAIKYDFDEKTGIVSKTFLDGGKKGYAGNIDLRTFYMALHQFFYDKGFIDSTKVENNQKHKGELDNKNEFSRPFNMYEEKFILIDLGDKKDFEFIWKAFKGSFTYDDCAEIEVEINLSNRFLKDIEVGEGLHKKTLQSGGWEFRNSFKYTNKYIANKMDFFEKFPIVSSQYLASIYANVWEKKSIEHDLAQIKRKLVDGLNTLIESHFLNK